MMLCYMCHFTALLVVCAGSSLLTLLTHLPFVLCESEDEMARTQKNKATEGHLGMLKARLAKLRSEVGRLMRIVSSS